MIDSKIGNHIEYIGARYVPHFAKPAQWSKDNAYEPLTIVLNQGNSYTSRVAVPKGIDILNEDYWLMTGSYNAQVELYRKEVSEFDERITAADKKANDAFTSAETANQGVTAVNEALGTEVERALGEEAYLESEIGRVNGIVTEHTDTIATNTKNINAGFDVINNINSDDTKISMVTSSSMFNQYKTSYSIIRIPKAQFVFNFRNCDGGFSNGHVTNPMIFMMKTPDAVIGSNCDFTSISMKRPMRINGINYNENEAPHDYPLLACDVSTQTIEYFAPFTSIKAVPDTYDYVFSISHKLIENGQALADFPTRLPDYDWNTSKAPRVGFGYDDEFFYLAWCEGRMLNERGMLMRDFAAVMKQHFPTIQEAFNFDGGGSACIVANAPQTIRLNAYKDFDKPFDELRYNTLCMYYTAKEL